MSKEDKRTLNKELLINLQEKVREIYLQDNRPWVIGFSGGKDSTATLQLVWSALLELPSNKLKKKIYVITSDTLVETPLIIEYLNTTLEHIQSSAIEQKLPIEMHKVSPALDETFWVNMIGRGYPAPSTQFRWCTERIKINPTTRFIQDCVTKAGEVVIVLGSRRAESSARAQVIEKSQRDRSVGQLTRHNTLPEAWVYTPIEHWTEKDVWDYLMLHPSPWGNRNEDLVALYKNASGECPLVVGTNTKPCGNSRFGCWTCTLVERDKSMEALFDSGHDWLEPLLDLRDWLYETRDPAKKHKYRSHRRRTGRIQYFTSDGKQKIIWGPYTMDVRKDILRRLLEAQKKIREDGPFSDIELITERELHRIRQMWRFEEKDWSDSLPSIYKKAMGEDLSWINEDWVGMRSLEQRVLNEVCEDVQLAPEMVQELLDAERKVQGMGRRRGIYDEIASILKKDWRSFSEVTDELTELNRDK